MGRKSRPHLHHSGWYRSRVDGTTIWRKTEAAVWAEIAKRERIGTERIAPLSVGGAIAAWRDEHAASDFAHDITADFERFAGDILLSDLKPDVLTRYVTRLRQRALAASTIRKKCTYARAILRWSYEQGWLDRPPHDVRNIPTAQRNPKPIRLGDLRAIFGELHSRRTLRHARVVLRFILDIGCRPAEACLLRWTQVDLDAGVCRLDEHKTKHATGRPRTLYLTPQAARLLRAIRGLNRPGRYVFLSRFHRPYTPAGLRSILRRAAEAATGEPAHTYQLRHNFAMRARKTMAVDTLAKVMGHRSILMTQWYYDLSDLDAAQAAASLGSPFQSSSAAPALRPKADTPARPRALASSRGSTKTRATKRRA